MTQPFRISVSRMSPEKQKMTHQQKRDAKIDLVGTKFCEVI